MYETIFTNDEIQSNELLQHTLNATGCSIKIDNRSPYAVDIYSGATLVDKIPAYSFTVFPNGDYKAVLNKSSVSDIQESTSYVSFKTVNGEVKTESGSTTFTGTLNVAGDMNITNSEIDVNVVAPVTAHISNSEIGVNVTNAEIPVTGNVNAMIQNAEIPVTGTVNAVIQNGTIPVEGNINANITNATINTQTEITNIVETNTMIQGGTVEAVIQGTVNANIENANLNTNSVILNNRIGTNDLIRLGSYTISGLGIPDGTSGVKKRLFSIKTAEANIIDTLLIKVKGYMTSFQFDNTTGQQVLRKSPVYTFTVGIVDNGTYLNKVATENPLIISSERSTYIDYTQATENDEGSYRNITAKLKEEEPVDEIKLFLEIPGEFGPGYDGDYWEIEIFAYNSDFNEETEGVEVLEAGTDLDNLEGSGFYCGSGLINAPSPNSYFLRQLTFSDGINKHQIIYRMSPSYHYEQFYRVYSGGAWREWKKVIVEGDIKNVIKYLSPNQTLPSRVYDPVNGLSYTATKDGQIEVYCQISFSNLTATATAGKPVYSRVALNGNWNASDYYMSMQYAFSSNHYLQGRKTVNVKKGDVVTIYTYADGGSVLLQNWTYAEFKEL